jgi:hypothetical protein
MVPVNREPGTATTPPPDSGPPNPPGRHRQSADTKGLSRPQLPLLVGSTNAPPICPSRPAQAAELPGRARATRPRTGSCRPPRPLSLRLPSRKSSDHRRRDGAGGDGDAGADGDGDAGAGAEPAGAEPAGAEPAGAEPDHPAAATPHRLTPTAPPAPRPRRRGWCRCRQSGAGDRDHAATRFRAARPPGAPSTRALTQMAFPARRLRY